MTTLRNVLLLLGLLWADLALAQYCPVDPPPDERDKRPPERGGGGGKCPGGGGPGGPGGPPPPGGGGGPPPPDSKHGDPIVMFGNTAYTFDRLEDFYIPLPEDGFSFQRTYYSSDGPWDPGGGSGVGHPLDGVPPPFGASRVQPGPPGSTHRSLRWTHNLFSFVDQSMSTATLWVVRPPNGNHEEFQRCSPAPCWAGVYSYSPGQRNRLRRTSTGFEYYQDDGKLYTYEDSTADAGQYYLSGIRSASGKQIATLNYHAPFGSCDQLSTDGVPYVEYVTLSNGTVLDFNYGILSSQCVLSSVSNLSTTLVEYAYEGSAPGLLGQAQTAGYTETFSYDGGFYVHRNGANIIAHTQTGSTVTSSVYPGGNYTYGTLTDTGGTGQDEGQYPCYVSQPVLARTATDVAARAGDGGDVSAGFWESYSFSSGYEQTRHTARMYNHTVGCTVPYSCSPGQERWVYRKAAEDGGYGDLSLLTNCNASRPGVPWGWKDKRDNWVVTPYSRWTEDGGQWTFEQRAVWRGVPSYFASGIAYPDAGPVGENALETIDYAYTYDAGGVQAVAAELYPSSLATDGGMARTLYTRDADNRVIAIHRAGLTMELDGTLVDRVFATFYTYTGGLLTAESGPCRVDYASTMTCPLGSPLIEYTYFGGGSGNNSGRLKFREVSAPTKKLTTEYGDYTVLGEPGFVIDENGVRTNFAYEAHNVARRTLLAADGGLAAEWVYDWDNERLISVGYPEGNYEAYCYRTGASPSSPCTGTWTGQLTKVSKAGSADGVTGWTEATVYEYWPDGTRKNETRYSSDGGAPVARFRRDFAADAHRRPTYSATGLSGAFVATASFDGADNRQAIGKPYNAAPAFCRASGGSDGSAGALSRLCAQLGYDRANRLRQLDLFRDPTTNTPTRACVDYDKRGSVTRVTTGCSSSDTCSTESAKSTCGGSDGYSHDYRTDDFGNVVEVTLSGTSNGSGGRGTFRYEYDARGNVVAEQTEEQRALLTPRKHTHTYDMVGRRTRSYEVWGSTPYTLAEFDFDGAGTAPPAGCATPVGTNGRVTRVWDPWWTRWYQYDAEGRVTREVRVANAVGADCSTDNDLRLSYTLNGHLSSMRYSTGREVTYVYASGGSKDRVASVSVNVFAGDGGVATRTLVDNVTWEPYGDLSGYRMLFPVSANTARLDYEQGAAASPYSTGCPAGALGEVVDQTGRLRSIRVSDGTTQLFRKTYVWSADQIKKTATCYRLGADGGAEHLEEDYSQGSGMGYDGVGQLLGVNNPLESTRGGAFYQRYYQYDARGNLVHQYVDPWNAYQYTHDAGTAAQADWLTRWSAGDWNRIDFGHDRDGRVNWMAGPADSTGYRWQLSLGYEVDNGIGPGSGSVFRTAVNSQPNGAWAHYTYWYDTQNRRQVKEYSLDGVADFYFYDLEHQLLADVGNATLGAPAPYPIDEYVWLAGRPIAVIRSKREVSGLRAADDSGTCTRLGDGVACGTYFLVTDNIHKPLLSLDGSRRIAGAAEYDSYGSINRRQYWWSTAHPSGNAAASSYITMQQRELGMNVDMRFHFPVVDLDQTCTGALRDIVSIWRDDLSFMEDYQGGQGRGNVWTRWVSSTQSPQLNSWGKLKVVWNAVAGNCDPNNCSPACTTASNFNYQGFYFREYEYRRYETGATPFIPPLRFPGHYWDAETDLQENWHRYYSPIGQYLSPEPMLQLPAWVVAQTQNAFSASTYAYARNNPLRWVDPNGLDPGPTGPECLEPCLKEAEARFQRCDAASSGTISGFWQCLTQRNEETKFCRRICEPREPPPEPKRESEAVCP